MKRLLATALLLLATQMLCAQPWVKNIYTTNSSGVVTNATLLGLTLTGILTNDSPLTMTGTLINTNYTTGIYAMYSAAGLLYYASNSSAVLAAIVGGSGSPGNVIVGGKYYGNVGSATNSAGLAMDDFGAGSGDVTYAQWAAANLTNNSFVLNQSSNAAYLATNNPALFTGTVQTNINAYLAVTNAPWSTYQTPASLLRSWDYVSTLFGKGDAMDSATNMVYLPSAVRLPSGKMGVYYSSWSAPYSSGLSNYGSIRLAVSDNWVGPFTKIGTVFAPSATSTDWDYGYVSGGNVRWRDDLKLYVMTYFGETNRIFERYGSSGGIATSPDGTNWTRLAQNPVIARGTPAVSWGTNDSYQVFTSDLVYHNGTNYLFYLSWGTNSQATGRVSLQAAPALSGTWTKYGLVSGLGLMGDPCVYKIGDSLWAMWCGSDANTFTSTNLFDWVKLPITSVGGGPISQHSKLFVFDDHGPAAIVPQYSLAGDVYLVRPSSDLFYTRADRTNAGMMVSANFGSSNAVDRHYYATNLIGVPVGPLSAIGFEWPVDTNTVIVVGSGYGGAINGPYTWNGSAFTNYVSAFSSRITVAGGAFRIQNFSGSTLYHTNDHLIGVGWQDPNGYITDAPLTYYQPLTNNSAPTNFTATYFTGNGGGLSNAVALTSSGLSVTITSPDNGRTFNLETAGGGGDVTTAQLNNASNVLRTAQSNGTNDLLTLATANLNAASNALRLASINGTNDLFALLTANLNSASNVLRLAQINATNDLNTLGNLNLNSASNTLRTATIGSTQAINGLQITSGTVPEAQSHHNLTNGLLSITADNLVFVRGWNPGTAEWEGALRFTSDGSSLVLTGASFQADSLIGSGAGITALAAANITAGTLAEARLPGIITNRMLYTTDDVVLWTNYVDTVGLKYRSSDGALVTQADIVADAIRVGNINGAAITATATISGNGGGLTNLQGSNITGTISVTSLSAQNVYTTLTNALIVTDANGKLATLTAAPTNSAASNKVLRATSASTTDWATQAAGGSGDVVAAGQNNFTGSNWFGGATGFGGLINDGGNERIDIRQGQPTTLGNDAGNTALEADITSGVTLFSPDSNTQLQIDDGIAQLAGGVFTGDGSGLTALNAAAISGSMTLTSITATHVYTAHTNQYGYLDGNGELVGTNNGVGLTNLTLTLSTNGVNTGILAWNKATFTNLTGNIVMNIAAPDATLYCTTVLVTTNATANTYTIQLLGVTVGTNSGIVGGTYGAQFITNGPRTKLHIPLVGAFNDTNASVIQFPK